MEITLTFDPADPAECERAAEISLSLRREPAMRALASHEPVPAPDRLAQICRELLSEADYGQTRLRIVRAIAEAAPDSAPRQDIYALAQEISPDKDPGRVVGGLHKSLEASWQRLGGTGAFFETRRSGFRMVAEVATAVRAVLDGGHS